MGNIRLCVGLGKNTPKKKQMKGQPCVRMCILGLAEGGFSPFIQIYLFFC